MVKYLKYQEQRKIIYNCYITRHFLGTNPPMLSSSWQRRVAIQALRGMVASRRRQRTCWPGSPIAPRTHKCRFPIAVNRKFMQIIKNKRLASELPLHGRLFFIFNKMHGYNIVLFVYCWSNQDNRLPISNIHMKILILTSSVAMMLIPNSKKKLYTKMNSLEKICF